MKDTICRSLVNEREITTDNAAIAATDSYTAHRMLSRSASPEGPWSGLPAINQASHLQIKQPVRLVSSAAIESLTTRETQTISGRVYCVCLTPL